VAQVEAMFDVPPSERSSLAWDVDIPIDDIEWNVGLIVGPSGCGKTTIARELFGDNLCTGFDWDSDRSILDSFAPKMSIKHVVGHLTSVGFGSPPAWLRPFGVLSCGEQFRVTIARALAESTGIVVVDEFTSVVDRQVATVASYAIQKAIRRAGRKFIAISCHYDIIDWLQPDWVYEPQTRTFARRSLQQHPPLRLELREVGRETWKMFAHHHYLSRSLNPSSRCVGGYIVKNIKQAIALWCSRIFKGSVFAIAWPNGLAKCSIHKDSNFGSQRLIRQSRRALREALGGN